MGVDDDGGLGSRTRRGLEIDSHSLRGVSAAERTQFGMVAVIGCVSDDGGVGTLDSEQRSGAAGSIGERYESRRGAAVRVAILPLEVGGIGIVERGPHTPRHRAGRYAVNEQVVHL